MNYLGFSKGEMPFRYLGVPLSCKKLTVTQCKPLVEKMVARIKCWSSRYFSYGGRLQLIKCVLFSIQTYLDQIFLLPKKVIKMIEQTCRSFLWTGEHHLTK